MVTKLEIKKRRPINKREAKIFNDKLNAAHDIPFSFEAGKFEKANSKDFDVIIQNGYIIAFLIEDILHFSVRGLLSNLPDSGWVHCSYKHGGPQRKAVLTAARVDGKTKYSVGLIE